MKQIFHTGLEHPDENLKPIAFQNTGTQTIVFKSFLKEVYPTFPEHIEKATCKPGRITVLSHRYYRGYTRDDSPFTGKILTVNEALEAFSEKSLDKGM